MEESKTLYVKRGTAVFGVVGATAVKQLAQETLNAGGAGGGSVNTDEG